ncbi:hypothetical protein [Burkholderia cepacia]|uniref:hypothetical protein n=1 Tax=Burkholderia cepacia TaxID=292 RepID=UPI000AD6E051|nr:hypothetical protein [Burkholderia cepacia]
MSEETQVAIVEAQPPQQLITIEPAKYVELVFEPFAKRLADAKTLAAAAEFDVTTAAGMAVAVKHRAKFREIRVASEKARKERKAPILEIGKLLDSRQKEIEAEIEPYESRFDNAIKAEEARKEAEKQAKLAAERERVNGIRAKITAILRIDHTLKTSTELKSAADSLSESVIAESEFGEFTEEAMGARAQTVSHLRELQKAAEEREAEAARLAEERVRLEKERAEAEERERIAAIARAQQEQRDREAREAAEREQRAAAERAAEAMRQQQAEHEARMAAERAAAESELRRQREAEEARLAEQRAELARQQAEIDAANAERERVEREAREAVEAEERRKREAEAEAARVEAERIAAEEQAREVERLRRLRTEFESTGPGDLAIVQAIALRFDVSETVAVRWLAKFDAAAYAEKMEKAA